MMKCFMVLLALLGAETCVAGDLLLLEFPTANLDSTRMALQELESGRSKLLQFRLPEVEFTRAPTYF